MEVSLVRKRLKNAIEESRQRAQQRRQQTAEAERAYALFLGNVATPIARMVQNALQSEGIHFTLFTPGGAVRLASDRGRDDYVELTLDTTAEVPCVVGRISQTRGSRTIESERPINHAASPGEVTEDDVLDFFARALEPWL